LKPNRKRKAKRESGPGHSAPARSATTDGRAQHAALADPVVRIFYRDAAGQLHLDWPVDRLPEVIAEGKGTLWVDIEDSGGVASSKAETLLRNVFGFHALAVGDALRESHMPKVDDWGEYLYLVFHGTSVNHQSDELRLQEVDIFLGSSYLVTYHSEPLSFLDEDREAIERDPRDRLQHGPDHLLFRLLEQAVDQSLEAIEFLDERVDAIQNEVIENPRSESLQMIFRIKRAAIELHKIFGPQREVLNRLARDPYKPIRAEHQIYFRDVYDHVVRIHDISESLRDLIAGTLDTYLSVMSNRTNDIMKLLTMVTLMFMPMSFITGFFGMNFFAETLAFQTPLPKALLFVASSLIMCISPALMWNYARSRKWF
jgi:magnesium transporter